MVSARGALKSRLQLFKGISPGMSLCRMAGNFFQDLCLFSVVIILTKKVMSLNINTKQILIITTLTTHGNYKIDKLMTLSTYINFVVTSTATGLKFN